jgi:histidinol-phosphate aminotransferase
MLPVKTTSAADALPQPKPGILEIAPYVGGKSKAGNKGRVFKLSSNENPLGPSPKAIEAYNKAGEKLYRYPDGNATELREAIAATYHLPVEQIVCGCGSDELIGLLIHSYAGVGDEVLYSQHGFLMYKIYALGNGATPVTAPEVNLTASVDHLLAAVTERTKILFLANPNNPTGSYLPASEIKRLRDGLPSHVILAIDAAYCEYMEQPDYTAGAELVATTPNTVMLRTFSKVYALGGLRLGWAYCPPAIADVLNRVRGPFNVSAPAIAAGAAAIADVEYTKASVRHNNQWREWLAGELVKLGLRVYPSYANFLLVKFPEAAEHSSTKANEFLLSEGIIVRDVVSYGLPDCLRISIGTEEETRAVAEALQRFMK